MTEQKPLTDEDLAAIEREDATASTQGCEAMFIHDAALRLVAEVRRLRARLKPPEEDDLSRIARCLPELGDDGEADYVIGFMGPRTSPEATFDTDDVWRLISEVRRLRSGDWIDAAAEEIAGDPECCDIQSSSPEAMEDVIRRHLSRAR